MKKYWKIVIFTIIVFTIATGFWGCQAYDVGCKGCQADTGGVMREITLYAVDGTIIGQWQTKYLKTTDGITSFIATDGIYYVISGTYIAREVK